LHRYEESGLPGLTSKPGKDVRGRICGKLASATGCS
jgi:hypothetical protein